MSEINTSVNLCGVTLKNPVMTASGTFGSGAEYSEFVDLNKLGAVVTKGVANVPWPGNPTPRVAEVYGGMLNAVGLQNPGIDLFCKRDIPFLQQYDTKIIVNVCGHSTEEYIDVVEKLKGKPVYFTIDLDVLDPSVFPGTGTPEAGGVTFKELLDAILDVSKLDIVGMDINELSPMLDASGASTAVALKVMRELIIAVYKERNK